MQSHVADSPPHSSSRIAMSLCSLDRPVPCSDDERNPHPIMNDDELMPVRLNMIKDIAYPKNFYKRSYKKFG
eukprot:3298854-Heterocapsa_arctica.AAC.1